MANTIGAAFVDVRFDKSQIEGQLAGLGDGLAAKMGGLGKVAAAGLAVGVGVAVVDVGKKLFDLGATFDDMSDKIRIATGKSGKSLDGLVASSKRVATEVPHSFKDAGEAVASLSSRLNLTGKPLEHLSEQVLELSRLTGTDLTQTLNDSTRLFAKWGLSGAAAGKSLDTLFRTSQATQIPVGRLTDLMVKFEAPLKQLGFGFGQSAALIGGFEKAGVNTEAAMGSLRIALGKLAKAGTEPVAGLRAYITAIKDAGTTSEANAIALKIFGARAGPEMAAAIRSGKLSVDELTKSISGGKDTILKAAKDTNDFSEKWLMFKNQVAVVLAPLAAKLFSALSDGMGFVNKQLPPLIKGFKEDFGPTLQSIGETIKALMPAFKIVFESIKITVTEFLAVFRAVAEIVKGVVDVVKGLLTGDWSLAWKGAGEIVKGVFAAIEAIFTATLDRLKLLVGVFGTAAKALGGAILEGLRGGLTALGNVTLGLVRAGVTAMKGLVAEFIDAARQIATGILNGIRGGLAALAGAVTGAVRAGLGAITGLVGAYLNAARSLAAAIVRGVLELGSLAADLAGKLRAAITGAGAAIAGFAASIGKAIADGIINGIGDLAGRLAGSLKDKIGSALSSVKGFFGIHSPSTVFSNEVGQPLGAGVIEGMLVGLASLPSKLSDAVRAALERGRTVIDASRGKLTDAWGQLSNDLLTAFDAAWSGPTKSEKKIADLEAAAQKAQLQAAVDAARGSLATAQAAGDQSGIVSAQKALDDALLQQQLAALRVKAAQERVQRDASVALKRRHFEEDLADLQAQLAREGATRAEANKAITALMRKYHIDYKATGKLLGDAFVTGLRESLATALAAAKRVADEIRRIFADVARSVAGSTSGGSSSLAPVTAAPGLGPLGVAAGAAQGAAAVSQVATVHAAVRGLASSLAASLTPPGPTTTPAGGSAGLPSIMVRVFIGDRELTDLVRTEVRVEQAGVARQLLAGSVA